MNNSGIVIADVLSYALMAFLRPRRPRRPREFSSPGRRFRLTTNGEIVEVVVALPSDWEGMTIDRFEEEFISLAIPLLKKQIRKAMRRLKRGRQRAFGEIEIDRLHCGRIRDEKSGVRLWACFESDRLTLKAMVA